MEGLPPVEELRTLVMTHNEAFWRGLLEDQPAAAETLRDANDRGGASCPGTADLKKTKWLANTWSGWWRQY